MDLNLKFDTRLLALRRVVDSLELDAQFSDQTQRAVVHEREMEHMAILEVAIERSSRTSGVPCDFAHPGSRDAQVDECMCGSIEDLLRGEIRLLFAQPAARHYRAPVALKGSVT